MKNPRYSKKQLIEVVLANIPKQLNYTLNDKLSIDDLYVKWFATGRQDGFRLTEQGDEAFRLAEIEYYEYPIKSMFKEYYLFLLELHKKIKCPYYLGTEKIKSSAGLKLTNNPYVRLYDSEIAMMISLYGSLEDYLQSIRSK